MNHTDIDWGYLAAILTIMEPRQPLFPIEEWPDHNDARLYLIDNQRIEKLFGLAVDDSSQPTTEQELQGIVDDYTRLHKHTNFLFDLEFIDQHDKGEWARTHPGMHSLWSYGYEVWPSRITAKGYFFLEAIRGTDGSKTGILQSLQKASAILATEAVKHGVSEIIKGLAGGMR